MSSTNSLMEVTIEKKSEWFDLHPNRNLLDANFEGYKLSLEPFFQYKLDLSNDSQLDTYNYVESGESAKKDVFVSTSKTVRNAKFIDSKPI